MIGVLSGGETDSSDEATLGGKIKEMANSVFDAMEAAGKEIDEALGEWGYSINTAISVVLIILFLSVIIGVERRIYSRTGRFYSEFLSIESGGVDLEVTKDEFRKLSSYRPLSWIGGSYSKANNLLKDARMNLNDLLLIMDRLSYLRVQIAEFRASGADVTDLEAILMELEAELLDITGKPMDFNSLEKIQQTWAKRDAERRELEKETGGLEWSSGNYTSMSGSPRNSLFSLGVIVLTFASLFLFIATFAEVCFESQYHPMIDSACLGDTDSYRNFFYGSSNWPIVLVAGSLLSFLNAIFITMLYGGPKALGEVNDEWRKDIVGKPKRSVNAGLFSGVFCLLMVVVMLGLGGWVFNSIGFILLASISDPSSTSKTMPNFRRIFHLKKPDHLTSSAKQYIRNETTIELALFFRFFVQLVIGLMFISWGIDGYTRVAVIWGIWSIFGLWMVWGAFALGIVLIQRIGRDEAVYSLYEQNFKKTTGVPNKMWSQFTTLCYFGFIIYILHHYLQSGLAWYLYYPLGLIQFGIVAGLVFGESPIKYKRIPAQIKGSATKTKPDKPGDLELPNKTSSVPVFKLEEHTDKSIKEIEEEQKALVSEMEDKS